jgi:hypothetical protein
MVKQKGGALGLGMALGMALPAVLGAAGKILPGIFGKKRKTSTTTNNYSRPSQPRQYYRPPPPPPQYYRPPPQYYRPPPRRRQQYYPTAPARGRPVKRLQRGSGSVLTRKQIKKWYQKNIKKK